MNRIQMLTPRERLMRAHQNSLRRFAGVRVPLFGLPTGWAGTRRTGASEVQTGVTRDDSGVHGEWNEMAELVHQSGESELSCRSSSLPASLDDSALAEMLGDVIEFRAFDVRLAGDRVAFAAAFAADDWVARWVGYKATVTLRGHLWPVTSGLELVRVTDLAPYHEGRLQLLEQRSGFDLRA